jgi:hypothetical protein
LNLWRRRWAIIDGRFDQLLRESKSVWFFSCILKPFRAFRSVVAGIPVVSRVFRPEGGVYDNNPDIFKT